MPSNTGGAAWNSEPPAPRLHPTGVGHPATLIYRDRTPQVTVVLVAIREGEAGPAPAAGDRTPMIGPGQVDRFQGSGHRRGPKASWPNLR